MTRSRASVSAGSLMRSVVALLAVGTLASCLTGENYGTTNVAPEADPQQAIRLLTARCTVCHSTDLITQQRLHASKWRATVNKMVAWGAQLSSAEQDLLVAYLASRYHADAPEVIEGESKEGQAGSVAMHGQGQVVLMGHPQRGATVYAQNCLPCHGEAGAGGVGPKLAGNAILAREESFQRTVMQGRGAMPAWGSILKPQEIADVHEWLKSLR